MNYVIESDTVIVPFDKEEAEKAKRIALKDMRTKRPKNAKKSKTNNK